MTITGADYRSNANTLFDVIFCIFICKCYSLFKILYQIKDSWKYALEITFGKEVFLDICDEGVRKSTFGGSYHGVNRLTHVLLNLFLHQKRTSYKAILSDKYISCRILEEKWKRF